MTHHLTLSDMLAGGPGHDGYAYNADTYCVACGEDIIREKWERRTVPIDGAEASDSECWPQPVFFGESDCAQHCGECGDYLYGPQEEECDDDTEEVDMAHLVPFLDAYMMCALWTEDLDDNYAPDDIAPETLAAMREDCFSFVAALTPEDREYIDGAPDGWGHAGHDFWLTRNRSGSGFWDGDWPEDMGRRLTDLSHTYGEYTLYAGDDGRVHGQ